MNPHDVFCPNPDCPARGQVNAGNIWIHARTPPRYRCTVCGTTFSPRAGTPFYRRSTAEATLTCVVTLIAYGCPPVAIEGAFGVQRQTVAAWTDAAGVQCEAVHQQLICQPRGRPLGSMGAVQADEMRVKQQGQVVWVAWALQVITRLWLGGVVSVRRDAALIARLLVLVKACALPAPLLVCVDGFAAGCPLGRIRQVRRMARTPQLRNGRRGRCRLVEWSGLVIGHTAQRAPVKQRVDGRVVGVTRRIAHGNRRWARRLLGEATIQTAYIERLNGTFRARLASLARRTRGLGRTVARLERAGALWAGWLIGTLDNFCTPHGSLPHGETPAMAAAGALWAGATMCGALRNCCITMSRRHDGDRRSNGAGERKRKRRLWSDGQHDHRSASTYLFVLTCFMKKSRQGVKTDKKDIERIQQRVTALLAGDARLKEAAEGAKNDEQPKE